MAHELVHYFVGMLGGYEEIDTPKEIVGISYPVPGVHHGESGCVWEVKALGGVCVAWGEAGHALGERQAGSVWIPVDGENSGYRVDLGAVAAMIRGGMFANPVSWQLTAC